jgi:hypothetical protein
MLRTDHLPDPAGRLRIADSGLSLATLICAASGAGKTTLTGLLGLQFLLKGWPTVCLDPTGSLSTALIHQVLLFLRSFPPEQHQLLWQRLRYIDVGNPEVTVPFPIYAKREGENVWDVSERLLAVIELSRPSLITQASVTWPKTRRVASNAGALLASLGYGLSHVEDLFFNTLAWQKAGLFDEAVSRCPEVKSAVEYFRTQYLPLSRAEQHRVTSTFLDHVYRLNQDPQLRLLFGGGKQGLNWEEDVEQRPRTVSLDFRHITDPEARRFALLWIFQTLYEHIKQRGRRQKPLVLLVDEFPALMQQVTADANPLATLFDELLARYARSNRIFVICCLQSLDQVDSQLRNTLLRVGNIVVSRLERMRETRLLADVLCKNDVFRVEYNHRVWAHEPVINSFSRSIIGTNHFVIDQRPEFMPLEQQQELNAQRITRQGVFQFLVRPAVREGEVSKDVIPVSIDNLLRDEETNEYLFPDETLISRVQHRLATLSGMPAATIRDESASPLRKSDFLPSAQASPLPETGHPAQPERAGKRPPGKTTPPPPMIVQLDGEQRAFLEFISANPPDTPISHVYKALSLSWRKGNQIRDSLREQGLLEELEVGRAKEGAGRPTKFFIPTLKAFELLGVEPPHGRGSVIHRYIQQLVVQGATDKGYRTQVEKDLGNGGIVDVHLENEEGVRIAVEVAVYSRPELELAHIKQCLAFGYERVFCVFAGEHLLARTGEALRNALSEEELGKVRFVPVSKLAGMV